MPVLLVVGAGLFGSQAAAYARQKGIEARVFDAALPNAASPAAAGLFKEAWAGRKLQKHFHRAVAVLDRLYGVRHVDLTHDDGRKESFLFVPPTTILEANPIKQDVTAVGDGWLEAAGQRHEGWVYVAAGVWAARFCPGLDIYGKAGTSFVFTGERVGRIRHIEYGRQAVAFVRDPGFTHFGDGTAERVYTDEHERQTLERAAGLGLTETPARRLHGIRPYTKGGPFFRRIADRTWLATGGRKMGTILGASFAQKLIEEEIH
ncbi:MAG: hypothetical protein L0215_23815 [Gemmataceae bacterium]|nr:hypothetical protein [Gemmataceae bacterium]